MRFNNEWGEYKGKKVSKILKMIKLIFRLIKKV